MLPVCNLDLASILQTFPVATCGSWMGMYTTKA